MNIQAITPNYVQNYSRNNYSQNRQQVGFTGVRGDEVVRKIVSGADVRPDELIKEMKGTFGIKKDVAEDIMESLIGKIKGLFDSNMALERKGVDADRKISSLASENNAANNRISYLESRVETQNSALADRNQTIAENKKEIEKLNAELTKYGSVMKIKSLEEVGAVTLEEAFKVMDDIVAHKNAAMKSVHDFLMTGKGQEEALAQIERNNILGKAELDGLGSSKEYIDKINESARSGVPIPGGLPLWFAQRMVQDVIEASPKSANYHSKAIAEQVKTNAMAILDPLTSSKWSNTTSATISKGIEDIIQGAKDNQYYLKRGIERLKENNPEYDVVLKEVPYDFRESKAYLTEKANPTNEVNGCQWNFYNLVDLGKRFVSKTC